MRPLVAAPWFARNAQRRRLALRLPRELSLQAAPDNVDATTVGIPQPQRLATTALIVVYGLMACIRSTDAAPTEGETSLQLGAALPVCPAGTHLEPLRQLTCLPCTGGTSYIATANRRTECFECSSCSGLIVESPCNATHNTVCRCPPGQYLNVDGGCTFLPMSLSSSLVPIENNAGSTVKWRMTAADVIQDGKGSDPNFGLISLVMMLSLIAAIVVGVIIWKCALNRENENGYRCKWKRKRRSVHANGTDDSSAALMQAAQKQPEDASTDAHSSGQCCAKVRAELDKETSEHAKTKELLAAKEREPLTCQQSLSADLFALVNMFRQEQALKFEQLNSALGKLSASRGAPQEASPRVKEGVSEVPSDASQQQVTDTPNRSANAQRNLFKMDDLKRQIEELLLKGDTLNIVPAIVDKLETFLEIDRARGESSPMEAEDRDARSTNALTVATASPHALENNI